MSAHDPDPDLANDEQYDSAADEDFQLDEDEDSGDAVSASSDEEEDDAQLEGGRAKKRRKIGGTTATATKKAEQQGNIEAELDSGDEATIRKAKEKKSKKKNKKGATDDSDFDDEDDEDGGEGGFVKTRSMRSKMHEERKPLAKIDGATIDVDALWAKMNAPDSDIGIVKTADETAKDHTEDTAEKPRESETEPAAKPPETSTKLASEEMIKIKRTYKFAGEVITEEKLVPRDSAEAKLFLSESKGEAATDEGVEDEASKKSAVKLRRPLRRVSRFDPNPTGFIKKSWEKQAVVENADGSEAKGPKLNTVMKSKLDWAAYVDQAGIKDELSTHSKAKEGYLGRMDFLNRVDAKKEEAARNARLRGI